MPAANRSARVAATGKEISAPVPRSRYDPPVRVLLLLVLILFAAAYVRLSGTGWDGFAGLHPDERHLFFVAQGMFRALSDPAHADLGLAGWWLSDTSPLNPHRAEASYVYGEAPLLLGVLAGRATGATDWFAFMPVARTLTALADVVAVLAVFLTARMLAGNARALLAALLYAAAPTALQLANFFTVDGWLSAATALALVPLTALATGRGPLIPSMAAAGAGIGLALACKITGAALILPALAATGLALAGGAPARRVALGLMAALAAALLTFRLANPFAFAGPDLWSLHLSADWLTDFRDLAAITLSDQFPPNWQWIAGYGPARFLRDFALFGTGPVVAVLAGLGLAGLAQPHRRKAVLLPAVAAAAFLLPVLMRDVAALRYAAPALPALAILAALAPLRPTLLLAAAGPALWWAAGAVRLHDGQHPRVVASHWLWTLPRGTVLTNETAWDEGLPAIVTLAPGGDRVWPDHDGNFTLQTLDITAPDSPEKADRIAAVLAGTDFLILSSDRQSAVMPRLPDRFPLTTAHYAALFDGRACFRPVLDIDRGFPLPGLPLNDAWAQEPWRVYDHPRVRIFQRQPCHDAIRYAAYLKSAL